MALRKELMEGTVNSLSGILGGEKPKEELI